MWICDCKTCDCQDHCIHPTGYILPDSQTECRRCGKTRSSRAFTKPFREPEPQPVFHPVDKIKEPVPKKEYNEEVASEPSYYERRKLLEL